MFIRLETVQITDCLHDEMICDPSDIINNYILQPNTMQSLILYRLQLQRYELCKRLLYELCCVMPIAKSCIAAG